MYHLSKSEAIKEGQNRVCDSISKVQASNTSAEYYKVADADTSLSFYDKGVVAQIINNLETTLKLNKKISDSGEPIGKISDSALITQENYGPYVMELFPLVTAWYPEFPLKDLITVQTMEQPLGYLFFSELKVGTTKGNQKVGDVVETPLGSRNIKAAYPTGEVYGEEITGTVGSGDTSYTDVLAYFPLKYVNSGKDWLAKYKVTLTPDATAPTDTVVLTNATISGIYINFAEVDGFGAQIDTTTGAITFTGLTANNSIKAVCNYVFQEDYANGDQMQTVVEEITKQMMEAQPRALAMEWSVFSEYLKKSQFGQDLREDNTKRMLNLLYQYQVRYILDDIENNYSLDADSAHGRAHADGIDAIEVDTANTYSLEVQASKLIRDLKKCANVIEIVSGRVEGNRIVCGKNLKVFCESLPSTLFTATPDANTGKYGFSAPREIGTFGTFKLYYDPLMEDENCVMTYRGTEWYDSSYILGEYLPMIPSDCVNIQVQVKSAFYSMEAYYFQKPQCVLPFTVTLI